MPDLVELARDVDSLHSQALAQLDECKHVLGPQAAGRLGEALAQFPPSGEDMAVICEAAGVAAALIDEDVTPPGPDTELLACLSSTLHQLAEAYSDLVDVACAA